MTGAELEADGPPVTPAELAAVLGVSARYVRKLVAAGALRAVRLPSAGAKGERPRLRIPRAEARRLARECCVPEGTEGTESRRPFRIATRRA